LRTDRDTNTEASLYLIDTATDKLSTIEHAARTFFSVVGWDGDSLVYEVTNQAYVPGQNSAVTLASFDAVSKKAATLAKTASDIGSFGYNYGTQRCEQAMGWPSIIDGKVIYTLGWAYTVGSNFGGIFLGCMTGKIASINSVNADGSGAQTLKTFGPAAGDGRAVYSLNATARAYQDASSLAIFFSLDGIAPSSSYAKYVGGKLVAAPELNSSNFNLNYPPTYYTSPYGKKTFWSVERDGKNTLFTGDENGGHAVAVATLSEYSAHGWYGEDFLLVTKNNSELYIVPVDFSAPPTKITDYQS